MNIYKISQIKDNNYDTYDSAIVAAKNENDAKHIHPEGYYDWNGKRDSSWVDIRDVKVELIGEAKKRTKRGVILASFNAG